jgi:hypothetical protein
MGEVALARLWQLPDGTTCLLLKDPAADSWEVRVTQNGSTVRHERFGNPIVAMEEAKTWRAAYDPAGRSPA